MNKIDAIPLRMFTSTKAIQAYQKACKDNFFADTECCYEPIPVYTRSRCKYAYLSNGITTPPADTLYWLEVISPNGLTKITRSNTQPTPPSFPVPSYYLSVPLGNIGFGSLSNNYESNITNRSSFALSGISTDIYGSDAVRVNTLYIVQAFLPANIYGISSWYLTPASNLNSFRMGDKIQVRYFYSYNNSAGYYRELNVLNVSCKPSHWYLQMSPILYRPYYLDSRLIFEPYSSNCHSNCNNYGSSSCYSLSCNYPRASLKFIPKYNPILSLSHLDSYALDPKIIKILTDARLNHMIEIEGSPHHVVRDKNDFIRSASQFSNVALALEKPRNTTNQYNSPDVSAYGLAPQQQQQQQQSSTLNMGNNFKSNDAKSHINHNGNNNSDFNYNNSNNTYNNNKGHPFGDLKKKIIDNNKKLFNTFIEKHKR